jgi:predicted nucleic acid-binding protein
VIFVDTNILLRSVQTSDPQYLLTEAALGKLSGRETLCIAPQSVVEFWAVATRPVAEIGMGMNASRAAAEIITLTIAFLTLSGLGRVIRDEVRQWRKEKK